ncbi:MAG TPA: SprT-like domain-containing protein [Nitrososphaerales archaeon]|nr:SprT-like domain-containing protein [Nitrososphaerales archaeon]
MVGRDWGIVAGRYALSRDARFRRLFSEANRRPPPVVPQITTVRSITLSKRPTKTTVGLTRYSRVRYFLVLSRPRQTITFYSSLLGALSDPAATAVIAHELAHAWLNEHIRPEESRKREREADRLARDWGFGPELRALDQEAVTVHSD